LKERTKKVFTNAAWNSGSFALIAFLMLLTTPFFVKKFGIEGYGIYILITSLMGYYGLLDLGLGESLIKFIAEYYTKDDLNSITKAINSAIIIQSLIGCVASVLLVILAHPIVHLLKISESLSGTAEFGISVYSLGFFFTMISSALSSAVKGLQRFDISSKVDSITSISVTLITVILVLAGYGLKECLVANVFVNFIMFLSYIIVVRNLIPSWIPKFDLDLKYLRSFFGFSFYLFLSKLSGIFANYIVRFVVSAFLSPVAVTYYVVPSKLTGAIGGFMGGAVNSLFPYASALNSSNDKEGIRAAFLKGSRTFAGIAAPISFTLILLSKPILAFWMGPDFAEKSWIVLSVLAMGSFIGSLSAIPNIIIMGIGNSRLVGHFALISLVFYVMLVPPFTSFYGILGTSIALLINSSIMILYVIYKTSLFLKVSRTEFLKTVITPHAYSLIILCLLFYFCYFLFPVSISLAFVIGIAYFVLCSSYLVYTEVIPLKILFSPFLKTKQSDQ